MEGHEKFTTNAKENGGGSHGKFLRECKQGGLKLAFFFIIFRKFKDKFEYKLVQICFKRKFFAFCTFFSHSFFSVDFKYFAFILYAKLKRRKIKKNIEC